MFLKYLSRKEQELFLELCDIISKSDSDSHEEEKEEIMIREYRFEMDLTESEYIIKGITFEDVIKEIKDISNPENINKIIFEIIGLIKADDRISKQENEYISKIINDLNISSSVIEQMKEIVDEIKEVYLKLDKLIRG